MPSPHTVEAVTSNVTEIRGGISHGIGVAIGNPFIGGQALIVAALYVPCTLVAEQVGGTLGVPGSPHGDGEIAFRRRFAVIKDEYDHARSYADM